MRLGLIFMWFFTIIGLGGMVISLFSGYFLIGFMFAFFTLFVPYRYAMKKNKEYQSVVEEVSKTLNPELYNLIKEKSKHL